MKDYRYYEGVTGDRLAVDCPEDVKFPIGGVDLERHRSGSCIQVIRNKRILARIFVGRLQGSYNRRNVCT